MFQNEKMAYEFIKVKNYLILAITRTLFFLKDVLNMQSEKRNDKGNIEKK